ncbi:hypothetical protein [Spirillospora sp. NPDC048819]|uniref:hypothetical protein n=1 Tax=Spirillospora sp. NPDC048819 TaxID=3155268 RepID=UPI0033DCF0AA
MSGWNPPPPPGGMPPSGVPHGAPPGPGTPYPPARRSSGGLVIGLAAAGLAVLIAIGVGAVILLNAEKEHTITTPSRAGGMDREDVQGGAFAEQIDALKAIGIASGFGPRGNPRIGVYGSGAERYLFVGGTGSFEPDKLRTNLTKTMDDRWGAAAVFTLTTIAGTNGADGQMACSTIYNPPPSLADPKIRETALCVWSTAGSVGWVAPAPEPGALTPTTTYARDEVAEITRRLRADVED